MNHPISTPVTLRLNAAVARLLLLTAAAWTVPAAAQSAFPATLAGHAVLPAQSLIPAPQDAPADLQISIVMSGDKALVQQNRLEL